MLVMPCGPEDVLAQIREWARAELRPWLFSRDPQQAGDILNQVIDDDPSVFRFSISDGVVDFSEKPSSAFANPGEYEDLIRRCVIYKGFLQSVVDSFHIVDQAVMVIDLDDLADRTSNYPIFCFQKTRGSSRILIPDVDFIDRDFYLTEKSDDRVDYDGKIDQAIFVGSTTGMLNINRAIVSEMAHQRIRSAVYFKNNPDVRFELPGIVQCDGPDTEAMIRALDIGKVNCSWQDQFSYRYLISVDGNGATCSRVAISLNSNSVLMKYDSINELYYFKGLTSWRHYIPVNSDADVLTSLALARQSPALPRTIAQESRTFYRSYLSRIAIMTYTAELLKGYSAIHSESSPASPVMEAFAIDSFAHLSNQGDVWSQPNGWLKANTGGWVEGIGLVNGPEIAPSDLLYCTIDQNGSRSDYSNPWQVNGSRGRGRPIIGFAIRLDGAAAERFDLSYEAQFLDGTSVAPVTAGGACMSRTRAPLAGFRLITRRRDGINDTSPERARHVEPMRRPRWSIGRR